MKWSRSRQRSDNLEDRRGASPGGFGGGLGSRRGGFPIPMGKASLPIVLIIAVLSVLGGGNILGGDGGSGFDVGSGVEGLPSAPAAPAGDAGIPRSSDPDAELVDFVSFVLDDVQSIWADLFSAAGETYQPAELVLFEQATQTDCGVGQEATGPFYCPLDNKAYVDLDFFRELQNRFGAPGDFAQAYVLAHEIGHHVQTITGTNARVRELQQRNPDDANELSVRQELQADCFAGVWAHTTYERGLLEDGDLEEGLGAAAAVGDDRLQEQSGARVNPESWTHGSSAQRKTWFRAGFDSGDPGDCDTFTGDL